MTSGGLWLLAQLHPANHSYFNPLAWQFIFCIAMFVGAQYNSDKIPLEIFRKRPWVLLACSVVGVGLLYHLARTLTHHQLLNLGAFALSDATLSQMKENLSAIRLVHFLSVAFLVAIFVRPNSPILDWPGASALIKSGRCSLQVFCAGAVITVLLNLFAAVEAPPAWERLFMDCLAVMLIASMATALIRSGLIPPSAVR